MTDEQLRYDRMVEQALRGVVRQALSQVAEHGLPGNHHFYLTFSTRHPGAELPAFLVAQYPDEMTIVLQYQYHGLEVHDDRFAVTLSFSNQHHRLVIPFAAITTFADPSVNFALQFQGGMRRAAEPAETVAEAAVEPEQPADDKPPAKVVTLDSFRKK